MPQHTPDERKKNKDRMRKTKNASTPKLRPEDEHLDVRVPDPRQMEDHLRPDPSRR